MSAPKARPATRLPSYLQRAIVSLPERMCTRERPLQDRIVFFEAYSHERGQKLERLLGLVWDTDTTEWCERGFIYNITSAHERLFEGQSFLDESWGDLRLFDTGAGGDLFGVGPERIHFARAADVDLFVAPQLAARLRVALADIEARYAAEGK